MFVIEPKIITPSMVISTNLAAGDQNWSESVTYSRDSRVFDPSTLKTYASIQDENFDHLVTDLLWWEEVYPSNYWAAFDTRWSTSSIATSPLRYTLSITEFIDSVSLHGLTATRVLIQQFSTDGVTGLKEFYLYPQLDVEDWFAYFYYQTDKSFVKDIFVTGLLPVASLLKFTIYNSVGMASVGSITIGRARNLGVLKYGVTTGIIDYSIKKVDANGNQSFKQGKYSRKSSIPLEVKKGQYAAVQSLLERLRAIPCAYVAAPDDGDLSPLVMLASYRDFTQVLASANNVNCDLQLESLI